MEKSRQYVAGGFSTRPKLLASRKTGTHPMARKHFSVQPSGYTLLERGPRPTAAVATAA